MKHVIVVLSLSALVACDAPAIQSIRHNRIEITNPNQYPPDRKAEIAEANRILLDRPTTFIVAGRGTCGRIRVLFGDGKSQEIGPANLEAGVYVNHTYTDWGGPKKVTAETVQDCIGRTSTEVTVERTAFVVGMLNPIRTACNAIPGTLNVRAGSTIRIASDGTPEFLMNFGGVVNRGIDGSPETALGPPFDFPFPGLKAHSLVLRMGSQVEQGGNGVSFVVRETGPLEICINDDVLADNTGAWRFSISVDERGAEP